MSEQPLYHVHVYPQVYNVSMSQTEYERFLLPTNCTCMCIHVNNQFKIIYLNINLKNDACTTIEKNQYSTM